MPYTEGPKMDWTLNDGIYHRFLKWHLKCENILECELAALPEHQQCKKVIAWSGDFGMDQYVSWGLPSDELTLDTIWEKFEEFCKPQSNEVHAQFDLLTSFRQGNCSIDEWYNMVQAQVNLVKYPPEIAKILHRDIFWFFLHDEESVSRTISDGSVDLDKFPASRLCQLAKKSESSKATAHHIKQVAGDPQAVQINLLRHQCTELPPSKYKRKKSSVKPKQSNHKQHGSENYQVQAHHKKRFDPKSAHNNKDRCSKCGDTAHIEGLQCPAKKKNIHVKLATCLDILPAFVSRKSKLAPNLGGPKCISYKQVQYMQKTVPYMTTQKKIALVKIHFACKLRSSAHWIKSRKFQDQYI